MQVRHPFIRTTTSRFALGLTALLGLAALAPSASLAAWPVDPSVNLAVCTADFEQQFPATLPDGAGGVFVVWQDLRDESTYKVYAQRISAAGVPLWGANGIPVCTGSGDQLVPHLTTDGAGGAIVTWNDARSLLTDIYCQRLSPTGALLWNPTGVPLCTAGGPQHDETVIPDGAGGAIVAWWDRRDNAAAVVGDVYAQRVNSEGNVIWAADGVPVCVTGGSQQYPMIVADGAGGGIITWADDRSPSSQMDIYAQRVDADGNRLWTTNGVPLCTAPNDQSSTAIATDGAGGAIVAWADTRSTERIYAQRISSAGAVQWTANGVPVSGGLGETLPAILTDGAGGAILAWMDFSHFPSTQADIRAQRISSSGATQWGATGVAVCDFAGMQFLPAMTTDGAGGAIVTWTDYRADGINPDLYARRVTSAGSVLWSPATKGTAVSTAVEAQSMPAIVPSGSGGAILAWQDTRNGASDIYAQRVHSDGELGGTVGVSSDAPATMALSLAGPNPARAGRLPMRFTLGGGEPASLELLDVAGRRIAARTLDAFGPGTHALDLGEDRHLATGLYFVRLRQGDASRVMRVAMLK